MMKKQSTILARYAKLSHNVCQAALLVNETVYSSATVHSNALDYHQAALDKFWTFVDKYMYDMPLAVIRQYEKDNSVEFKAFD